MHGYYRRDSHFVLWRNENESLADEYIQGLYVVAKNHHEKYQTTKQIDFKF